MNLFDPISNHILFNYYSFGTLLVIIFTFGLSVFFLTKKDKNTSTFHLGMGMLFLVLFNTGYLFAAFYYHPFAVYHRWFTAGFILPAITHFGQFFFQFPRNSHPKIARPVFQVMWGIAIIAIVSFVVYSYNSGRKFHFTGHYWDFDAETGSRIFGILIALYSIVSFIIIPGWKIYITKTKERYTIIQMMLAMLVAAVVPNVTNIMSRDGVMERSTFLSSLVLLFVLAFFFLSIVYINSTNEKTSFMVKIVGLTMVVLLLIMQALSFYTMQDKEDEYDEQRADNLFRILEGGNKTTDTKYILELPLDADYIQKKDYSELTKLDLPLVEIDLRNTAIYEEIKRLPESGFRQEIIHYLLITYPYFEGYKNSILDFLATAKLEDSQLKSATLGYFEKISKNIFVHRNRISNLDKSDFCNSFNRYITEKKDLIHFQNIIDKHLKDCRWDGREIDEQTLFREVSKYFRNFIPALKRNYRKSVEDYSTEQHFIAFAYFDKYTRTVSEVGYSYTVFRQEMHKMAIKQQGILVLVVIFVLIFYPLFFKGSLVNPLADLLKGVDKVNNGDFEVEVPVKVQDEIGFLADSFNSMVLSIRFARAELQHYAETLEQKVSDRTKEVQEKMQEVEKLKDQQDGDYYLTSLLMKPLFYNANKSEKVKTDFFIKQKKSFRFRSKEVELGGDICITGNLRMGTKDEFRRYTVAVNGDAMGKSMQGAGGALVMGVVVNSIMARSSRNNWVINKTPEEWLTDFYYEVNRVFKAFNGSMVISCLIMIIDDESGEVFFFNAEHPFSVLYRGGRATFIEKKLMLRKLGLDSEIPFEVFKIELIPGDVLIIGSDGRDDVDLSPDEPVRTINEDETVFLRHVLEANGDLHEIYKNIIKLGKPIDDISLMRIAFQETPVTNRQTSEEILDNSKEFEIISSPEHAYQESKKLIQQGEDMKAKQLLHEVYNKYNSNAKIAKLYGLLLFKDRDYLTCVKVIRDYLKDDPLYKDFWYYLSVSEKKLGHYNLALEAGIHLKDLDNDHVLNLLNLSDIYRLMGNQDEAVYTAKKVLEIEPENQSAKKLLEVSP